MKIKALISFAGIITMAPGDERDVSAEVGKDLIRAGHAVEVKSTRKAVKSDEDK